MISQNQTNTSTAPPAPPQPLPELELKLDGHQDIVSEYLFRDESELDVTSQYGSAPDDDTPLATSLVRPVADHVLLAASAPVAELPAVMRASSPAGGQNVRQPLTEEELEEALRQFEEYASEPGLSAVPLRSGLNGLVLNEPDESDAAAIVNATEMPEPPAESQALVEPFELAVTNDSQPPTEQGSDDDELDEESYNRVMDALRQLVDSGQPFEVLHAEDVDEVQDEDQLNDSDAEPVIPDSSALGDDNGPYRLWEVGFANVVAINSYGVEYALDAVTDTGAVSMPLDQNAQYQWSLQEVKPLSQTEASVQSAIQLNRAVGEFLNSCRGVYEHPRAAAKLRQRSQVRLGLVPKEEP